MSAELGDHIDWLTGELADRDQELSELREAFGREEAQRVDAQDDLTRAEREIRELRDQIDYIKMGQ